MSELKRPEVALLFSHWAYENLDTCADEDWGRLQRSCNIDPQRIRAFNCSKYGIGDTQFIYDIHEPSDTLIVAFRGTKTWNDIITDINLYKDKFIDVCYTPYYLEHERGKGSDLPYVHQGFYEMFNMMKYELLRVVRRFLKHDAVANPRRILLTGHSLGGALSILASAMLYAHYHSQIEEGALAIENITFGSPKVGNTEFKRIYDTWMKHKDNRCTHYYHSSDPVPCVPFIKFYALSNSVCINERRESMLYSVQYHHLESYRDRIATTTVLRNPPT